ncbi:MAG TPA: energy transducer TonB [Chitinophagaceae bacterium]|nr:energy transducer TonB [Chitinophagaceae bacterium]
MNTNEILQAQALDIVFDGRNKAYGAYELRKTYHQRLAKGLAVMLGTCLSVVIVTAWANNHAQQPLTINLGQEVILSKVDEPKVDPVIEKPKPQATPPEPVRQIAYTNFNIVPNDADIPPIADVDDLDKARIGAINVDGGADDGRIAPPVESGTGTGNSGTPAFADNDDGTIFTTVQIEAQFPGGLSAWKKFLERNLNRDLPLDNGAPVGRYTVVVSFVVDKYGQISDVQAENNPGFGTMEEAVRVILKSQQWTPAVQNGRNVTYRQKQSITFVVSEEG